MKSLKLTSAVCFAVMLITLISCGSNEGDSVMSTEDFLKEASSLGKEAFEEKYPRDSEIELKGEVRVPATWNDRIDAKFGTGFNDLPFTAKFMFATNGGSEESTKEKVVGGKVIHFKGKIGLTFFDDAGKLEKCTFEDCTVM